MKASARQSSGMHAPELGACGGMYTANTMASAIEALGMTLPYSASTPAEDPQKVEECVRAGAAVRNLMELNIRPRDIMTREAFENAMVTVAALGGSTNAVLHLIAMARSVEVALSLDDIQAISDKTPLLADFKPSGPYVMEDLQGVGGLPAVYQAAARWRTLARRLSDRHRKDGPRKFEGLAGIRIRDNKLCGPFLIRSR